MFFFSQKEKTLLQRIESLETEVHSLTQGNIALQKEITFLRKHLRLIRDYEMKVSPTDFETSIPFLFAQTGLRELNASVKHIADGHRKMLVAGMKVSVAEAAKNGEPPEAWYKYRNVRTIPVKRKSRKKGEV